MRGVFSLNYGPQVNDMRCNVQVPSRPHQQPSFPNILQVDNSEDAPPSRHLWVGNVSQDATEGLLMERFSEFGLVERVTVYSQRNYAFVNFRDLDSATDAKDGLQGVTLGGLPMRIEFAKGAKPSRHLWVGGISQAVSREKIEGEFKKFGMIEDFKFVRDRNCAFVDFVNIEDATGAVNLLNGTHVGGEELRVDFGRSQPSKREVAIRPGSAVTQEEWWEDPHLKFGRDHSGQIRTLAEPYRGLSTDFGFSEKGIPGDVFRGPTDGFQAAAGSGTRYPNSGRTRIEKDQPSDVLWIGFPLLSKVDEDGLRKAFVPYGEIERVKTFPGRTYAFVQFKKLEEAARAKEALEGKLFNDPRVHIRFSNSEIGPVDNPRTTVTPGSPSRGRDPPGQSEKPIIGRPAASDNFRSMISALHTTGLRPEYYPGGLGRGGFPRSIGSLPSISPGHNVGRGNLGQGGCAESVCLDHIEKRGERRLTVSAARRAGRFFHDDQWDLPEEESMSRDAKRLRIYHPGNQDSPYDKPRYARRRYPEADKFAICPNPNKPNYVLTPSLWNAESGEDEHTKETGVQRVHQGPSQIDLPPAGQRQVFITTSGSDPTRASNYGSKTGALTGVNEGWRWHGTIAKGGTPVCRAQCLPVGKGIDVTVSDVVNCTARTDLDMLAKHVQQAREFGVVFFVPEGDPDVLAYHDFMHYLGEKHRAGVAKLADETTLFLVPPSDFSERVLKVPGNNCLFGVVLKSRVSISGSAQLQQQQPSPQQTLQLTHLPQQRPQLPQQLANQQHGSQSQGHAFVSDGIVNQDSLAIPVPAPPKGQSAALTLTNGLLSSSQLSSLAGGLPTVLTPELIVSLTALLPGHNQLSASLPMSSSSTLPAISEDMVNTGQLVGKAVSKGLFTHDSTITVHSLNDNNVPRRFKQYTQQSNIQPAFWPSDDQLSGSSGQRLSDQRTRYAPPLQQIQAPQGPHSFITEQLFPGPLGRVQQANSRGQVQDVYGDGCIGQLAPHHLRPQQRGHLGSAPLLPSEQLSELTTLLTQRQHQPAQQQKAAQYLPQNYQPQQFSTHMLSQQQHALSACHQQEHSYGQQIHRPHTAGAQQSWLQGQPSVQNPSNTLEGSQVSGTDNKAFWNGPPVSTLQQQQVQRQVHLPSPTPHQLPNLVSEQQSLHQLPTGGTSLEQRTESVAQDDTEHQKRFQATLQLAAALLQQMQHQQTPRHESFNQR